MTLLSVQNMDSETEHHCRFPLTKESATLAIRTSIYKIRHLVVFHTERDQKKEMHHLITYQKIEHCGAKMNRNGRRKKKISNRVLLLMANIYQIESQHVIAVVIESVYL